jgi:YD repeat-containing protein
VRSYTYGANNMIATKLDANNQKTVYSYDSYTRVTEIQHFFYLAMRAINETRALSTATSSRKHPGGLSTQARPKLFQSPPTLPAVP